MSIQDEENVFFDEEDGFGSSLIDTVKFRLRLAHEPLVDIAAKSPRVHRDGRRFTVEGQFPGTSANIWSPADNQSLVIEASVSKFLTGQNVFGLRSVDRACEELGRAVLDRLGIEIDEELEEALRNGNMALLRVDAAGHLKCSSEEEAAAVMAALRRLAVTADGDWCAIKNETVTLGSWSRRRTFTIYRKDIELAKRLPSSNVWRRSHLLAAAKNMIRFELSLAGQELRRQGVRVVRDCQSGRLFEQLSDWFKLVACTTRPLPIVAAIEKLPDSLALRVRAWTLGDANAFAVAPSTRRQYRRQILELTGIDINSPLDAREQRKALRTVRDALVEGLTLCDRSDLWERLRVGRRVERPRLR